MTEQLSEADIFAAGTETHALEPETHQPEPQPNPRETVRAEEERPTPNLGQLPDQGEGGGEGGEARPEDPFARERTGLTNDLKTERQRRQEYERQLAERDRQLAEMRGQMAVFERMVTDRQQPAQQQKPEPKPAPDPFEDPQGFARHQALAAFEERFTPFQQRFESFEQRQAAVMQGLQRQVAASQYGADVAREAEEAFNTAAARNSLDRHEWERIQGAPNPFAAAVEWHQRQKAFETVGNDPNKWFEAEMQRKLSSDPAFQQSVFALLTGQAREAAGAAPAAPAAAPGAKPAPVFAGLPSLNAAAGTSARQSTAITEADIYAAAPPNMGGRR